MQLDSVAHLPHFIMRILTIVVPKSEFPERLCPH
jgi:hypothetical protein